MNAHAHMTPMALVAISLLMTASITDLVRLDGARNERRR